MEIQWENVARAACDAYAASLHDASADRSLLPVPWEYLGKDKQEAWIAAVKEAARLVAGAALA